jgi:hypothetical protein
LTLISVAAGQPIRATHVQQFTRWITGALKSTSQNLVTTSASDYSAVITNENTSATAPILKLVYGTGGTIAAVFAAHNIAFTVAASALSSFAVAAGLSVTGGFQMAHTATGTTPAASWSALYPITNGTWERRTATNATFGMLDSSLTATAGTLIVGNGANTATGVPIGTARFSLQANAGATSVTYAASMQSLAVTAGDVFAANAANAATRVAAGGGTTFLRGGTAPAFSALTAADFAAGIITTAALGVTSVSQVGSAAGATSAPLTVSGTYVDIPDMTVTMTTSTTCDLIVWFNCTSYNSNPGAVNVMGLSLDGAAEVAEIQPSIPTSNATISPSIAHRFSGVSATAHTIKARWYTNAGTAVMLTTLRRMIVVALNR